MGLPLAVDLLTWFPEEARPPYPPPTSEDGAHWSWAVFYLGVLSPVDVNVDVVRGDRFQNGELPDQGEPYIKRIMGGTA